MDDVRTVHTSPPRPPRGSERRIKQLLSRHKAELDALKMQVEYMQRVAATLIPLIPKQIVAVILQDAKRCHAKGENRNVRPR
jgi:hypothetical protein